MLKLLGYYNAEYTKGYLQALVTKDFTYGLDRGTYFYWLKEEK